MRFATVCSGIGAPEVAFSALGWECAFASEIEPFARAVYAHHFPATPLHGDFTKLRADDAIDVLVAGTPCQDFSVAGLRSGLAGDRGSLTLAFIDFAQRLRPRWMVWENVPGVLSADEGRAFGMFLGRLAELGYGFAYRVLDAAYFGVPQRRRRVFVVGHIAGAWQRAVAVLFERESLSWNPAPCQEARAHITALTANGLGGGGPDDNNAQGGHLVAHALSAPAAGPTTEDGTGRGVPLVAFGAQVESPYLHETALPVTARKGDPGMVAFAESQSGFRAGDTLGTLDANYGSRRQTGVTDASAVRRLTPIECERLMGFPDDYTLVPYRGKPAADGPRYRALGNSMVTNVVRWIGRRIAMVEDLAPW